MTVQQDARAPARRPRPLADEAREVMDEIMRGEATSAQIGGFLVALRLKGETADEIAGCAEAMRAHVLPVKPTRDDLVDTAGTGGDGAQHAQHLDGGRARRRGRRRRRREARQPRGVVGVGLGRRARGARLRARAPAGADRALDRRARLRLPVRADAPPRDAARRAGAARARDADRLQRARPADEPGRRAGAGRRRLRAEARARRSPRCSPSSARGARSSCTARAGSTSSRRPARTSSARSSTASVREREIDPLDLGIPRCDPDELRGGTPGENATTIRAVFAGEDGGARDAILLNAAGAIAAAGHAADLREGLEARSDAVDSGAALRAARRAGRVLAGGGGERLMGRFRDALAQAGLGAIAEVKRRSPSRATCAPTRDPAALAAAFERAGAAAVSVLVDERFGGTLADLARRAVGHDAAAARQGLLLRARRALRSCERPAPTRCCCCSATSTTRRRATLHGARPASSGSTRSSRRTTPRSSSARSSSAPR